MSTRAFIGYKDPETKTISLIYNHSDGYPEYLGALLETHFQNEAKVKALMALGDVSSLNESIETPPLKEDGSRYDFFEIPAPYSRFYGRDRGELGTVSIEYSGIVSAYEEFTHSWAVYMYIYDNGTWYVYTRETPDGEPLENVLSK